MGRESKEERDAAFTAFMTDATPSLLRTAWLLTGSAERSQELVQAALVKTYAAWPSVRRDSALAFARRVLVNQKTDTWRKTSREVVGGVPERSVGPDASVEHRDQILRLLDLLPAQQRRVVVLRYYQDLSEQQTAEMLGVSVGSVKSAASRGLSTLRSARLSTEGSQR